MSHEFPEDGELSQIQNFLAFDEASLQNLSGIKDETQQARLNLQRKMGQVMDSLLKLNHSSHERIVYDFSKPNTSDQRAVVIGVPLLNSDDESYLSVRYLAVTTLGIGYILYDDFSPVDKTMSSDYRVRINLYSPLSEITFEIKDFHQ